MKKEIWCNKQIKNTTENAILCAAHLIENRVFDCPYKNFQELNKAKYPCVDYSPIS